VAAVLLCGAQAFAQDPMQSGSSAASAKDKLFVTKAMQGSMAEVQLGQLASQNASSQQVKDFGQKMVDDHTKLNEQMKPVAAQLGITPPTSVSPKQQALMTKLQGLNGAAFDKAYVDAMVADHKEDDKDFKAEETSGKNMQVKDAATQGEPVIAEHLQMIEQIQQKMRK
jgi:putative membrane protein